MLRKPRKPRRHRATQAHSRITTATSLLSHSIASSSVVRASQNSVYTTATAHTAPRLPQVRSICEAKGAPGCEECMAPWRAGKTWGDCDLLSVYSRLCSSSPGAACVAALQYITCCFDKITTVHLQPAVQQLARCGVCVAALQYFTGCLYRSTG